MRTDWRPRLAAALVVATGLGLAGCSSEADRPEPGTYLAIAETIEPDAPGPSTRYIRVVEMFSGEEVLRTGEADWGLVRWSPDGRHLLTFKVPADEAAQLVVLDFPSGEEHAEPLEEFPRGLPAWSPDGEMIAFSGDSLTLFDAEAKLVLATEPVAGTPGRLKISEARWSPDSEQAWIVTNNVFILAGLDSGEVRIDLVQDPPLGLPFGSPAWTAAPLGWFDNETIALLISYRPVGPKDPGPGREYSLVGHVEGTEIVWAEPTEPFNLADWLPQPPEMPVEQLAAAVPDGFIPPGANPIPSVDGSTWVYPVLGGDPARSSPETWPFQSKIVAFNGEATGIVEVGVPAIGGRDAWRLDLLDVVVVPAK